MTKEEFANKLEVLLTEYTGRDWMAWVVFGQAPGADGAPDTIILSGITPDDLPRAFAEVSASINEAEHVAEGKDLMTGGPTVN